MLLCCCEEEDAELSDVLLIDVLLAADAELLAPGALVVSEDGDEVDDGLFAAGAEEVVLDPPDDG